MDAFMHAIITDMMGTQLKDVFMEWLITVDDNIIRAVLSEPDVAAVARARGALVAGVASNAVATIPCRDDMLLAMDWMRLTMQKQEAEHKFELEKQQNELKKQENDIKQQEIELKKQDKEIQMSEIELKKHEAGVQKSQTALERQRARHEQQLKRDEMGLKRVREETAKADAKRRAMEDRALAARAEKEARAAKAALLDKERNAALCRREELEYEADMQRRARRPHRVWRVPDDGIVLTEDEMRSSDEDDDEESDS